MKKVLIVSQHYWPENFRITDICKGMAESGIEVDVLCGLPNYPKGEWFEGYGYFKNRRQQVEGVNVYRAGEIRRKNNTSIRIFLNYISFPVTATFNLLRLIGKKYDAVFCYETSPVLMMIPAIAYAKLARIPLTTYVLDLWPENLYSVLPVKNKAMRSAAKNVSQWLYRRSERLIALSAPLGEKLKQIAPKRQITVIPQYCEDFYAIDIFEQSLITRFKNKFVVAFAGNFSPAQNLDLLVECAKKLKQENRQDIHFVLIGDGMSYNGIKRGIEENGLMPWFSLEGSMPPQEIPKYHTMASALFAALAKSDDLGLTVPAKIAGYMAAGKPLLVAIDGEAANTVRQWKCGIASEAGNVEQLYSNIKAMAEMPNEALVEMGDNSRICYEKNYKRDVLLKQLIDFIFWEVSDENIGYYSLL